MERLLIVVLTLAMASLGCRKEDNPDPNGNRNGNGNGNGQEPTELTISLGADTTIFFGDTLTLDPGPGYATYLWNDGLSTAPTLPVWEAGTYWVHVTDSLENFGSDTIAVELRYRYHSDTVPCVEGWKTYRLVRLRGNSDYSMSFPCHYNVWTGWDGELWGLSARAPGQKVIFGYSHGAPPFMEDTILVLPNTYMQADIKLIISDMNELEVGAFYYYETKTTLKYYEGWFLFREDEHYIQHSLITFAQGYLDEVAGFLSTVKHTRP